MTVQELVTILQQYPGETPVALDENFKASSDIGLVYYYDRVLFIQCMKWGKE